jgi:CDP-diacylglycerol---glycerol-3-phosphate 3-phosphatidyltransferase
MFSEISDQLAAQGALASLKRHWTTFSLAGFLALGGSFLFLYIYWEQRFAIRWGITATLGLSYLAWLLWHNLPNNCRPGEAKLLPALGPGNTLTIVRGTMLAFLAGFLFLPQADNSLAWAPAILFTLVIAADYLDGYAARISNHVTRLGEALDMSLDGLGILIAVILSIQYGQLPPWYLVVALARYLFLGGVYIRSKLGYRNHELLSSVRRRAFAGLQMGFISVMLWPIFAPPGTYVAALIFAIPFLGGFLLDWLILSGVINPKARRRFIGTRRMVTGVFPLVLRTMLLIGLILFSENRFIHYSNLAPSSGIYIFAIETLVMVFLVLGVAGRLTAIMGLLLLGVNQIFGSLQLLQFLLIIIYISAIYMGTGPYSLWKPEDHLIFRKAGEARSVSVEVGSTAPSGD